MKLTKSYLKNLILEELQGMSSGGPNDPRNPQEPVDNVVTNLSDVDKKIYLNAMALYKNAEDDSKKQQVLNSITNSKVKDAVQQRAAQLLQMKGSAI